MACKPSQVLQASSYKIPEIIMLNIELNWLNQIHF